MGFLEALLRTVAALLTGQAFQRWGMKITVPQTKLGAAALVGPSEDRVLGCASDRDGDRAGICAVFRAQMLRLKAWAHTRRAEGTAFAILGDFNRRLALRGNRAWRLLSPASAPLGLLTEGVAFRCDPRYSAFIDHLVVGGGAEVRR